MLKQGFKILFRSVCGSHAAVSRCSYKSTKSIQKCYTRRQVPSLCSVCMKYHSDAGNQTEQIKTDNKERDVPENNSNEQLDQNENLHIPVLKDEVLSHLGGKSGQTYLDMTFGAGGHTRALLDNAPNCHIYALDRDPFAHNLAMELAEKRSGQITPLLGRFSELPTLLASNGVQTDSLDGVLFDLGCSSMQFDMSERGFSLSRDGPLDMRMDGERSPEQPTAADVVNSLDEVDLIKIFKKYGEEKRAVNIADAIVDARSAYGRITRTKELADIIDGVCEGSFRRDSLGRYSHPATKIFQALRIFVNNELNELNSGLEVAHRYLKPGGICVAISFHSLEDRIVKRHFHMIDLDEAPNLSVVRRHRVLSSLPNFSQDKLDQMIIRKWKPVHKKVTVATSLERENNPRSRSAKLRTGKKLVTSH